MLWVALGSTLGSTKTAFGVTSPISAGPIESPEDLYRFLSKLDTGGFSCTLCMKYCASRRDGKNHLEAIHFPDRFSYNCPYCGKEHNSKNTLNVHISRRHKEERNMLCGKNIQ